MAIVVTSTKAKVSDTNKLQELIDRYQYVGFEVWRWEGDLLQLTNGVVDEGEEQAAEGEPAEGEEEDGPEDLQDTLGLWGWPMALKRDELPSRDQYPDEAKWKEAMVSLYFSEGHVGFYAFLQDLAIILQAPMVVVGTKWESRYCGTEVWSIRPGDKKVERVWFEDGALLDRELGFRSRGLP